MPTFAFFPNTLQRKPLSALAHLWRRCGISGVKHTHPQLAVNSTRRKEMGKHNKWVDNFLSSDADPLHFQSCKHQAHSSSCSAAAACAELNGRCVSVTAPLPLLIIHQLAWLPLRRSSSRLLSVLSSPKKSPTLFKWFYQSNPTVHECDDPSFSRT